MENRKLRFVCLSCDISFIDPPALRRHTFQCQLRKIKIEGEKSLDAVVQPSTPPRVVGIVTEIGIRSGSEESFDWDSYASPVVIAPIDGESENTVVVDQLIKREHDKSPNNEQMIIIKNCNPSIGENPNGYQINPSSPSYQRSKDCCNTGRFDTPTSLNHHPSMGPQSMMRGFGNDASMNSTGYHQDQFACREGLSNGTPAQTYTKMFSSPVSRMPPSSNNGQMSSQHSGQNNWDSPLGNHKQSGRNNRDALSGNHQQSDQTNWPISTGTNRSLFPTRMTGYYPVVHANYDNNYYNNNNNNTVSDWNSTRNTAYTTQNRRIPRFRNCSPIPYELSSRNVKPSVQMLQTESSLSHIAPTYPVISMSNQVMSRSNQAMSRTNQHPSTTPLHSFTTSRQLFPSFNDPQHSTTTKAHYPEAAAEHLYTSSASHNSSSNYCPPFTTMHHSYSHLFPASNSHHHHHQSKLTSQLHPATAGSHDTYASPSHPNPASNYNHTFMSTSHTNTASNYNHQSYAPVSRQNNPSANNYYQYCTASDHHSAGVSQQPYASYFYPPSVTSYPSSSTSNFLSATPNHSLFSTLHDIHSSGSLHHTTPSFVSPPISQRAQHPNVFNSSADKQVNRNNAMSETERRLTNGCARGRKCVICGSESTSQSRKVVNRKYLCNACGIYRKTNGPSRPLAEPKQQMLRRNHHDTVCTNCNTTTTSRWGKHKGQTICNACRLYLRRHKVNRPIEIEKKYIQKRNRKLPFKIKKRNDLMTKNENKEETMRELQKPSFDYLTQEYLTTQFRATPGFVATRDLIKQFQASPTAHGYRANHSQFFQ